MKILILGAGYNQLNTIRKAINKGHTVIVSDYLPDAPGKKIAQYSEMISTFDIEGNIGVARKHAADGVITVGTDQPVLTAARAAEELGLPSLISSSTALKATNKIHMKTAFDEARIPSSDYRLITRDDLVHSKSVISKLKALTLPLVIKPVDSQGQRGVFKIDKLDLDVIEYLEQTFSFTRANEVIVEEFIPGDEITVSAWVKNYIPHILLITDRPLWQIEPHLGVPDGHIFPSRYLHTHYEAINNLTDRCITALDIPSGPVYIQMIINGKDIRVIEIACRIGGGHEEELIPLLTGIDPVDMLIDCALGYEIDGDKLRKYNVLANKRHAMVKFVRSYPGDVAYLGDIEEVKSLTGVVNAAFYNPSLTKVSEIVDSTCRIGYLVVTGENPHDLIKKVDNAYKAFKVYNSQDENMVY